MRLHKSYIVLDDVRSMENVGSIFRTSDAAGIEKIYLCGITPKPPRREIDKAALGAVDFVKWEYREDIINLINDLKKEEIEVVSVEQSDNSISFKDYTQSRSAAFIFGNEKEGIKKKVLDLSDKILEIPMHGQKNSLNVAVAVGIVVYNK